eukprot:jgi/Orpsp1_1/1177889/evm.model.c7180000063223.2
MKFYNLNHVFIISTFILKSFTYRLNNYSSEPHHVINWSPTTDELKNITLQKIEEEKEIIEQIENIPDTQCTFENVVVPLITKVENEMTFYDYSCYLLQNVAPEREIRRAAAECYSSIEEYSYNNVWMNEKIYKKILAVQNNINTYKAKSLRNAEDKRLLENLIKEFRMSGLGLSEVDSQKLAELDMKIGNLEYEYTDCIYE